MSEPTCKLCRGEGRIMYGSTSTYFGGIGGAAMTMDLCKHCWGSGDSSRPFASQLDLHYRLHKAEKELKKYQDKDPKCQNQQN